MTAQWIDCDGFGIFCFEQHIVNFLDPSISVCRDVSWPPRISLPVLSIQVPETVQQV